MRGIPRRGVAQVVAEVVSADQPLTPPVATTGSTGARLRGEVTRTVDIPAIQGRIWRGEPLKLHERSVVLFDLTTRNGTLTPGGQLVLAWQAGDFEQAVVQHITNHELETGATSSIDAALTCQATGTAGLTCPLPRLGRGVVAGFRVSFVPKVPGQRALNLGITIPPHLEATFEPAAETLRVRGVDLSFELTAIETAVGKLLESPPTLRNTGLVDAIAELSVAWDPAVFVWEGTPPCGSVDAQVGQLVCTTTLPAGESAPIPWSLKALKRAPQAFVTVMALTQPATDEETPQNNSAIVTVKVKGPDLTIAFEPPSTPTPVGELVEGVTVELKNQDANAEARNAGFSYQWDPTIFRWEGALECVGQGLLDQSLGLANCRYTDPIPPQGTRALPWSFRVLKRDKAKQTITVKAVLEPLTDDENPPDNTRPIALEVAPADLRLTDGFDVSPPALRVGEPRIDTPLLSFTNAGGSRVGDIALTCTWPNATLRVTDLRVVLPAGGATLCPLVTENGKTGADCVIPGPIAPSEGFVVHGTVTGRERSMAAPLSCWARSQDKTIEDNLVDNAPSTTFSVEGIDARIVFNAPTGEVLAKEDTLLGAELRVVGEGAIEGARLLFDTPIADAAFVEVSVSGGAGPCTTDTTTGRVTCPVPKLVEGAGEIVSIAWRAKRPKTNVPLTVSWDPETVPKLASTAKPSEVLSLSPRGVRFEPTVTVTTDEPLLVRPALGFDFKINATVTNTGPRTAEDVVLEIDHDIPSAGVSVVGAPGCSFDPATQRHRCEIAELEQGASVTRTLTLRAERKVPKFLATAFVKNGDVELVEAESKSSAEAGGQIQGADLVPIVVTPPELDMGGDPVALTFSVINTGPGKATTPGFELSFDERFHELALNNAACDPSTVAPGSNTAKMGCRWQGLVLAPTEVSDEIILYFKGKKPSRQAAISVVASQVPTDDEEDKANDIVPRALPVRGPDLAPSIPAPLPPLG
ncbi:MAG TPA: hypothetical protein PK095_13225, partial [Myxococcota bacterium]|nr:hypothetical protein [Myxococcota bacterium]